MKRCEPEGIFRRSSSGRGVNSLMNKNEAMDSFAGSSLANVGTKHINSFVQRSKKEAMRITLPAYRAGGSIGPAEKTNLKGV